MSASAGTVGVKFAVGVGSIVDFGVAVGRSVEVGFVVGLAVGCRVFVGVGCTVGVGWTVGWVVAVQAARSATNVRQMALRRIGEW